MPSGKKKPAEAPPSPFRGLIYAVGGVLALVAVVAVLSFNQTDKDKAPAPASEAAATGETPSFVVELDHDKFMKTAGMPGSHTLVLFYAPWCTHCTAMMPEYEQTAALFASESNVVVSKVDATANKKLKKLFNVTGYPTMFYFAPGSISPVSCETRNAEGLVKYLNEKAGTNVPIPKPPRVPLPAKTAEPMELVPGNFDEAVEQENQGVFVMFYAPWCIHCEKMLPHIDLVSAAFADVSGVVIAKVDGSAHTQLKEKYAPLGFPTTLWFGAGADEPVEFNGERNANAVIRYINEKAGTEVAEVEIPVVDVPLPDKTAAPMELASGNINKLIGGEQHVLVKFYAPWCTHCKNMAPAYEAAAKAFADIPNVVVAKLDGMEHPETKEKYGVSGFPTLKFFKAGSTEAVEYPSGRDVNSIIKFLNEEAGTAVEEVELPPEPEVVVAPSEDGPLPEKTANPMEVGAGNFDKLIGGDNHVLVKFYAPWCGHCKNMIPAYQIAAKAFASVPNVVIAKLDGMAHPAIKQRYDVSGFPTLMFFKAGSTEPVEYNSGRDADSLIRYVNGKAGTSAVKDEL